MKSRVFVGSSVEGIGVAYAVQQNLRYDAEVTIWNQGVFELSKTSIESLTEVLERSDFGIFVFTPDDIVKMREKVEPAVRDNVIFELGLFIGKLGRNKTFIIIPENTELHIPTDLLGVTPGRYENKREDSSLEAATGPACHLIRQQIKKHQILNTDLESPAEKNEKKDANQGSEYDQWFKLFLQKDYDKAILNLDAAILKEKEETSVRRVKNWRLYCNYLAIKGMALEELYEYIDANNKDVQVYEFIGRFLLWEKDLPKALPIIDNGLKLHPKALTLILLKAEYFEQIGEIDKAISLIEETEYSLDAQLSLKLCTLYEEKKTEMESARRVIHNAYINNAQSEVISYKYARICHDQHENEIALYLFYQLTLKYPDKPEYLTYLSNCCVALSLNNLALSYCQKADELSNSKESWILANIGNIYNNCGLYGMAIQYLKKSREIDDESDYVFTRLSEAVKSAKVEKEKFDTLITAGSSKLIKYGYALEYIPYASIES